MATIRLDGPQIEELKNLLGAAFTVSLGSTDRGL
jgi:hypothetical protein